MQGLVGKGEWDFICPQCLLFWLDRYLKEVMNIIIAAVP